jgi:hypothetical protein
MKTAYEIAMARLNKKSPGAKLSDRQKQDLAELDAKCTAKIAEREIALKGEIVALTEAGESEKTEILEQRLVRERKALQTELEEKKEQVRRRAGRK